MSSSQGEPRPVGNIEAGPEAAHGICWGYMFPIISAVCFVYPAALVGSSAQQAGMQLSAAKMDLEESRGLQEPADSKTGQVENRNGLRLVDGLG